MKRAPIILQTSALLPTFIVTKQLNVMQDTEEIWKDVVEYEEYYQVSSLGNIKNKKTGRLKVSITNWAGYSRIQLFKDNKGKIFSLHRVVASAFIPNDKNLPEVNHKDHNRANNVVENLEWCTRGFNAKYSFTRPDRKKARAWLSKGGALHPKSKGVLQIKNGDIINSFGSICEASRVTQFSATCIGKCCLGKRKSHKGFQWEYK